MAKPLANPGNSAPTHLDFTDWPNLAEFFQGGGQPGVEYLYLCPEEVPRATREGWDTIVRMPYFTVNGTDLTAVARGIPIPGARPGSSVCQLHVSNTARERATVTPPAPELDADAKLSELITAQKSKVTKQLEKVVGAQSVSS